MSRSPGARRLAAALLLIGTVTVADEADHLDAAEQAVAARDWQEAARIWEREAEAGDAEAYMGLGNLWDLGFLGERDRRTALAYYRKAADAGVPAAAFNVAAMYATGSGTERDMITAATWYAHAALRGHDRAAFALGRLFAEGKEVPGNPGIAASWLEQAADTIPAARDMLAELDTQEAGRLNAPVPLTFRVLDQDGKLRVDVAWSASPGPKGAVYRVEVSSMTPEGLPGQDMKSIETRTGGATLELPDDIDNPIWRVMMVDGDGADYAATDWFDPFWRPVAKTTLKSVRVDAATGDDRARTAAESMADGLRGAGLKVAMGSLADAPSVSTVRYRFETDEPLARDIARFLPAFDPSSVELDPSLDTAPGEVVVLLAFDGSATTDQSDN